MGVPGVPRASRCGGDSAVLRSLPLSASGPQGPAARCCSWCASVPAPGAVSRPDAWHTRISLGEPGACSARRDARRLQAPAAGLETGAGEGSPRSRWPALLWRALGFARSRSGCRQGCAGTVAEPSRARCADLCHRSPLLLQQPVPGSTRRLRAGTMEAAGGTPASPTRRVQTIVQVSVRGRTTPALARAQTPPGALLLRSRPPRAAGAALPPLLAPILLGDRQPSQLS